MLTKEKSKQVLKWKYVLLMPVVFGMLLYTSCDLDELRGNTNEMETFVVGDIENLTKDEESRAFSRLMEISKQEGDWGFVVKDKNSTVTFSKPPEGSFISGSNGIPLKAKMHIESKILDDDFDLFNYKATHEMMRARDSNGVAFAVVDEVPIFPGCEDETDKRACFNKMIQKHISKNFRYPQKAREMGVQGRVNTMFVIAEDGSIQNVRMRGPDSLLENEVARIIKRLPKMTPGKDDGKTVRVPFSIPVTFKLEQSNFNAFYNEKAVADSEELSNQLFGQSTGDAIPFSKVDEAPTFPGCANESNKRACFQRMVQRHISKNFNYPQEAQEKGIQGRVMALFTIGKDGIIQNVRMRGPDRLLEKEVVRIISRLPRMIPGKHKNALADVTFSIPVTFKLQGDSKSNVNNTNEHFRFGASVTGSSIDVTDNGVKIKSNGENDPIYFIDEEESTKEILMSTSPDDIESISVFKNEAALKKYGEKGRNGVVEIITKKQE